MTQIVLREDNIGMIMTAAPQCYTANVESAMRCIQAGEALLEKINSDGMCDDYDQEAARFIEKARKTVKKMNERRTSVTKIFDDIRKEYTTLENSIDPTKGDTVAARLQSVRNQYAAYKRAAEEERRKAELARQQEEEARKRYGNDVKDDLKEQFQRLLTRTIGAICGYGDQLTLDNYDSIITALKAIATVLPEEWTSGLAPTVARPYNIQKGELDAIDMSVKAELLPKFREQYTAEVTDNRDYMLDRLPSMKKNLELMASAKEDEAQKIAAEMEERRRREAAEREQERQRAAEEERRRAELARQQEEMNSLFLEAAASVPEYSPKMKVSKKLVLLNPEGIMPVIGMWWAKEGCTLSIAELEKMFKKQITYCEKLMNKEGIRIENESVDYVDDVKAR